MATNITISLVNGQITLSQDEVTGLAAGDSVSFTCQAHHWAVQLIAEGAPNSRSRQHPPFSPSAVRGGPGVSGTIVVDPHPPANTEWDYVVAVYDGSTHTLHTKDPDLVIGNRPGG